MKRAWIVVVLALVLCPVRTRAVDLQTPGKSALLMDVATGTVLYEANSHEALAPASVTKVMTESRSFRKVLIEMKCSCNGSCNL